MSPGNQARAPVVSAPCAECRSLESVVVRLGTIHREKVDELRLRVSSAGIEDVEQLLAAESTARRNLEIATAELMQHKQSHAETN